MKIDRVTKSAPWYVPCCSYLQRTFSCTRIVAFLESQPTAGPVSHQPWEHSRYIYVAKPPDSDLRLSPASIPVRVSHAEPVRMLLSSAWSDLTSEVAVSALSSGA